jgi:nucleoside-diphosphate-sugar epimerase
VDDPAWSQARRVRVDREAEDAAGAFGSRVASLDPDVVVDLLCFTLESARQLVSALRHSSALLLHCGTIWVHGPATEVPVTEDAVRKPFGDYGVAKADIETYLLTETGLRAVVLHAGHIVGPGWEPCNPAGNFDLGLFGALARGEDVALPNFGLETLHHVHADDVASAFCLALEHADVAAGQSFHVTSPRALTLRGYAEAVAGWFGQEARLRFAPYETWAEGVDPAHARVTWEHIARSPSMSIEKARATLGYAPRSSLRALRESISWLIEQGRVDTGGRALV